MGDPQSQSCAKTIKLCLFQQMSSYLLPANISITILHGLLIVCRALPLTSNKVVTQKEFSRTGLPVCFPYPLLACWKKWAKCSIQSGWEWSFTALQAVKLQWTQLYWERRGFFWLVHQLLLSFLFVGLFFPRKKGYEQKQSFLWSQLWKTCQLQKHFIE